MTPKESAWAAVDIVIDLAAESGIKYRRGDFYVMGRGLRMDKLSSQNVIGNTAYACFDCKGRN